jgi:hypothetical protein
MLNQTLYREPRQKRRGFFIFGVQTFKMNSPGSHLFRTVVIVLMTAGGSFAASPASAQRYVNVRPNWMQVERPVAPSPAHVWIDEDWEYRSGHYVAIGNHWAMPPHHEWIWVKGRWDHSHKGWQWMPGHWRKR